MLPEVLTPKPDAVTIETSELLPWEARRRRQRRGRMVEGGRRASEANLKASIPEDLQPLTALGLAGRCSRDLCAGGLPLADWLSGSCWRCEY